MALTPKPFDPAAGLIRSLFRGRPNLMADVDVNRQLEAIRFNLDANSDLVGCDAPVMFTGTASYDGSGNLTYNVNLADTTIGVRGASFHVGASNFTQTLSGGGYKSVFFYLLAKEKLVTFADDPVYSGIDGDGFAAALPGADNEVYFSPTIVAYPYPDVNTSTIEATVGGGYHFIAVIGGIIPVAGNGSYTARLATYTAKALSAELKGSTMYNQDSFNGRSLPELISHLIGIVKRLIGTSDKIGMCTFYSGPLTGVWDNASGLGISGGWQGWAIMDGRNGTEYVLGKFMVGIDPSDFTMDTIGDTGGAKTVSLTGDQNGTHHHNFQKIQTQGSGTTSGYVRGLIQSTDNTDTDDSGLGLPHENMPPYVAFLPVKKIS